MGAGLYHADRRRDRHDEANSEVSGILRKRLNKNQKNNIKKNTQTTSKNEVSLIADSAVHFSPIQSHYIQCLFSKALTQQPNDSVKDDDDRTSLISQSSSRLCATSGVENAITSVKLLLCS